MMVSGGPCTPEPRMAPFPQAGRAVLTLAEVAELHRFRPRYLRAFIRRHGIPVLRSGRLIRFDALALCALEEALRCPSPSPAAVPVAVLSPPPALSPAVAYANALRATTPNSPRKRRQPSRQR